jgi:hypothetical protein
MRHGLSVDIKNSMAPLLVQDIFGLQLANPYLAIQERIHCTPWTFST